MVADIGNPEDKVSPLILPDALEDSGVDEDVVEAVRFACRWCVEACERCIWTPYDWVNKYIISPQTIAESHWSGFSEPFLPAGQVNAALVDVSNGQVNTIIFVQRLLTRVRESYRPRHEDFIEVCNTLASSSLWVHNEGYDRDVEHLAYCFRTAASAATAMTVYDLPVNISTRLSGVYQWTDRLMNARITAAPRLQSIYRRHWGNSDAYMGPKGTIAVYDKVKGLFDLFGNRPNTLGL